MHGIHVNGAGDPAGCGAARPARPEVGVDMFRQHFHRLALGLCLAGLAAAPVAARDLTIGLASSVTAIDPHYHFTGANMSMSRHFFDPLIIQDEERRLRPGLAGRGRRSAPTTWEFKLRQGVKSMTAPTSPPKTSSTRCGAR